MRHLAVLVFTGVVSLVGAASAEQRSATAVGVLAGESAMPTSAVDIGPKAPPRIGDELAVELIATRPQTPIVDQISITVDSTRAKRMKVVSLSFTPRDVGADTVSFELALTDSRGQQTLVVPRDTTYVYPPNLHITDERVRVEVRAIDSHGTRSMPALLDADVRQQYRCGLGHAVIGLAQLLATLGLVVFVLTLIARRRAPAVGPVEPVSPLVADHIVRIVLRRSASMSVAVMSGVLSAAAFDRGFLAVLLAIIALLPLTTLVAARRVSRALDRAGARAEVRGPSLILHDVDSYRSLHASRGVIASARRQSVPSSIVR